MDSVNWLDRMLADSGKLKREATRRRKEYKQESIAHALVPEYQESGWEVVKELKTKTRVQKPFNHDERLENRVWYLFYLLGYPEVSEGRNFNVVIDKKGAPRYKKQIDVLAKDDETVVVAECKSCEKPSRRSLQKDLSEFESLKGPISSAIKKHYPSGFKPKIIWLFVTENINWSEPDKNRAKGSKINIVTEKELRYYLQIADHLRSAARFQFLAEFLKGQKIPELDKKKVPAIRGKLGGRNFYSFVSTPRQLLKIAFINHRSLNDPSGAPSYQRLVNRTRLRQISRFIQNGGFFPTNILVNFPSRCNFERVAGDDENSVVFGNLFLPNTYRSAWVIDGQHRLYGYAPLSDRYLDQHVMVVAFEGLDKTEEANLFVTINHEQKSVPKTLLDDLEGELKWGSSIPSERVGAISARLIQVLNLDIGEALYGRVAQQGIRPTDKACLTVPALKEGVRRSGLIGRAAMNNKELRPGPLSGVDDSDTLERARAVLCSYFRMVADSNPHHWNMARKGYLLTNVGIQGYLALFSSLIEYLRLNSGCEPRDLNASELVAETEDYLDPVLKWLRDASERDMERQFKVVLGSGGLREYYFRLCSIVRQSFPDFEPEGLGEWLDERSEERANEADRKLKELNIVVQRVIFDILKKEYGEEDNAYWEYGVIDNNIKTKAYQKSLETPLGERLPLEHYLDLLSTRR